MTSQKLSKGTLTLFDMEDAAYENLDKPIIETHNSVSFLSQILNDINMTSNENKSPPQRSPLNSQPSSYCFDSSNSSVQLYEMKSLHDGTKTPNQIQFRFHKKVSKKKKNYKQCRFSDEKKIDFQLKHIEENDKIVESKSAVSLKTQTQPINNEQQSIQQPLQTEIMITTPPVTPENSNKQTRNSSVLDQFKKSFNKIGSRKKRSQLDNSIKDNLSSQHSQTSQVEERVELYYFDHGNAEYFRTTDCPPNVLSEIIAQQTTYYATRFWAEIFGSLHIGVAFILSFFLQTYRFLLSSIIRSTLIGFLQITSDYLFKPIITILFNGYIQPPLILLYNIFASIKDMLEPIGELFAILLRPIEGILRAIRLINIKIVKDLRRLNDVPITKTYIKDV